MEVNITPTTDNKTRKMMRNTAEWKRNQQKKIRYSPHTLPVYPTCGHKTNAFQCTSITMTEIKEFHSKFYETKEKIVQDNFILKYCKTVPIKRKRPKNDRHTQKVFQAQFFVLTLQKTILPVCKKAFMDILCITRRRIDTVTRNFFNTSLPPKENRGGDRKLEMNRAQRDSVMKFINKFKAIESHYCRGHSSRLYLSSTLNIRLMWKMYVKENINFPVKESYFRLIFNTEYNIGFGTPRTDVCSTCLQLTEKIKRCNDQDTKARLLTEKKVHKMKAEAFYQILREPEEGVVIFSFDCQKNQVLSKVPDQQAYYSRQIYMFNFTVVRGTSKSKLNPNTITCFCWTENEYDKGSNEIASCIHHVLNSSNFTDIHTIKLMCNGCAGQNKNTTLISMCCIWLAKQNVISKIEVVFPVRGHSFISPDRVFGHIEVECKKKEIILEPQEYLHIFSKYGTLLKVGKDVEIYDWKTETSKFIRPPGQWHFAFSKMKRMVITKNSKGVVLVRGEGVYNSNIGMGKLITKKARNIINMKPSKIPIRNVVSSNKKTDLNNLLTAHYGNEWKNDPGLIFYKFVIEGDEIPGYVEEDILCERHAIEDEINVAV